MRQCPGEQLGEIHQCVGSDGVAESGFSSTTYCAPGLKGPFCSLCVQYADATLQRFYDSSIKNCRSCDDQGSLHLAVLLVLLTLSLTLALALALALARNRNRARARARARTANPHSAALTRPLHPHNSPAPPPTLTPPT